MALDLKVRSEGELSVVFDEKKLAIPYFITEDQILVLYNALPFADGLVQTVQTKLWEHSTVITGGDAPRLDKAYRTSKKIYLGNDPILDKFSENFGSVTSLGLDIYQMYGFRYHHLKTMGYEVLRYGPGEEFKPHVDQIVGHPTYSKRKISVVAYPNDDYEGGEIVFPLQRFKFKPPKGSLILFPSDERFLHASLPVTSGTKYAVVSWLLDSL